MSWLKQYGRGLGHKLVQSPPVFSSAQWPIYQHYSCRGSIRSA